PARPHRALPSFPTRRSSDLPGAVGVSSVRIVDAPRGRRGIAINKGHAVGTRNDGSDCRQEGGEVAVPDGIGRDVFCRSTGRPNFSAFVSPKEEQFVLLDGSAESSTILVEDVLWLHGLHDCRSEVVTRAKLIVGMVLEGSAVKLVGA